MRTWQHSIDELLHRLDAWLRFNRPSYLPYLRPPVTSQVLLAFESSTGLVLPPALKSLWSWHNGQTGRKQYLQLNYAFLGCDESLRQYQGLNEILDEIRTKDNDPNTIWWSPNWIPFLTTDADLLCVDTQGSFGGIPGQVINFFHDDPVRLVEYAGIEQWLATFVISLETGMWQEGRWTLEPRDPAGFEDFKKRLNPGFPRKVDHW